MRHGKQLGLKVEIGGVSGAEDEVAVGGGGSGVGGEGVAREQDEVVGLRTELG